MNIISFYEKPKLNQPFLIAGFEGWPNAGNISTETLLYLKEKVGARKFAEIDPDPFHQYTHTRPCAKVKEGEIKDYLFSPYEFFYKKGDDVPDLILFIGKEPELRWNQFVQSFLTFATDLHVETLLTIGGTYDCITHKQDPLVSGVFNEENLRMACTHSGIKATEYEGPISIHTILMMEAEKLGIKAVSIWGHAPQYLQSNNLAIIHQILTHLNHIGGFGLDLTALQRKATDLNKQIDMIVQKNPELSRFIEKFENLPPMKKETSPQDKVINLVDFLKKDPHEE